MPNLRSARRSLRPPSSSAAAAPTDAPPVPLETAVSPDEQQAAAQETAHLNTGEARDGAGNRSSLILRGNVHQGIFRIAVPSVATMLLVTLNQSLDSFFVGKLGSDALAALTVCASILFTLMSGAMAVSAGTTALIARFVGENNNADGVRAARQSLLLAVFLSILLSVLMWFLRAPLLNAMKLDDSARAFALSYLGITILGLPSLFVMLILNGVFRGLGDTVRPFWVTLGANVVHAAGNYLLIEGRHNFPRLGLPGGALALLLSQLVAAVLYGFYLFRSPLGAALSPTLAGWKPDWFWMWRIARIGLPAAAQQFARAGSFLAFQALLAGTAGAGTAAVAALGVGLRSEAIAFMPGFGYSIAAAAFVGQNLGARQVRRAHTGAWSAAAQAVVVMSVMGLVFYVFAEPFVRIFVQHVPGESVAEAAQAAETTRLAVLYLRIAVWSEPFLALGMVLTGALQGAGETKGPTVVTIATMIVLRLPLAWVLATALGFGAHGAWWAMTFSTMMNGVLVVLIFRRGKWRHIRV